jgi:hypothetical protein
MGGRFNRPTNFGNNRGCIFTVEILVGGFWVVGNSDIFVNNNESNPIRKTRDLPVFSPSLPFSLIGVHIHV